MKFLALLSVAPVLIGATEPVRLQPIGSWQLDYADNSCRLARQFGSVADPTTLLFEQTAPDRPMSMVVVGKSLGKTDAGAIALAYFRPGDTLTFRGETALTVKSDIPAATWTGVGFSPLIVLLMAAKPPASKAERKTREEAMKLQTAEESKPANIARSRAETIALAGQVTSIELEAGKGRPVTLESGSLGKPLTMMSDCLRDLLRHWGVDPDVQDKIAKRVHARRPAYEFFRSDDYPLESLRAGQQSTVRARVLIDATGKVTDCVALSHFEAPEFQKTVCEVIRKRASYEPAELADGSKVPSYDTLTIRFQIR